MNTLTNTSPSTVLHEWTVNNLKVFLIKDSLEKLTYQLRDHHNDAVINQGNIPISSGKSIDRMVKHLLESCNVIFLQSKQIRPHFAQCYSISFNKSFVESEIKLLRIGSKLVWQKFDNQSQTTSWSSFEISTRKSMICKTTVFQQLMNSNINERLFLIQKKFWISSIRIQKLDDSKTYMEDHLNFNVLVEPKWTTSKINKKVAISTFKWGLTILTFGGISGNHALFAVEGIDNAGEYFLRKVEFTGLEVRSDPFPHENLKYGTQSETWIRDDKHVINLLEDIEKQKNSPPKFALRGNKAWGNSDIEHSCITWLTEQFLKIEINLEASALHKLYTRTKDYTKKPAAYEKDPVCRDI